MTPLSQVGVLDVGQGPGVGLGNLAGMVSRLLLLYALGQSSGKGPGHIQTVFLK